MALWMFLVGAGMVAGLLPSGQMMCERKGGVMRHG